MVDEIASQRDVLRSVDCTRARDDAVDAVAAARQLDALYRGALAFATRAYCTS